MPKLSDFVKKLRRHCYGGCGALKPTRIPDENCWRCPDCQLQYFRFRWQAWANSELTRAIRFGQILPAKKTGLLCADCDAPATEWEHRDYTRPLAVEPICHSCNCKRGAGLFMACLPPKEKRRNAMRTQQIDLGHRINQSPDEPIPYFTEQEVQEVRQQLILYELQRLERNVRQHYEELAKPV